MQITMQFSFYTVSKIYAKIHDPQPQKKEPTLLFIDEWFCCKAADIRQDGNNNNAPAKEAINKQTNKL